MWNNLQCLNCLKRASFLAAGTSALSLLQKSQGGTSQPGRLDVGGACQLPLEPLSPVSCLRWHVWRRDVLLNSVGLLGFVVQSFHQSLVVLVFN